MSGRLPSPVEPPLPVADEPLPAMDPASLADTLDRFANQDMAGNALAAPEDLGAFYDEPAPAPRADVNLPKTGLGFDVSRLAVQTQEEFDALEPELKDLLRYLKSGVRMTEAGMAEYVIKRREEMRGEGRPLAQAQRQKIEAQADAARAVATKTKADTSDRFQQAFDDLTYLDGLLEQIKAHPGRGWATGATSMLPIAPGSEAENFKTLLDQVQGQQFLRAYQTLKGGGQITEVEGRKATEAMARMNRGQSEKAFLEGVSEFQQIVREGARRARTKLTPQDAPAASTAAPRGMTAGVGKTLTAAEYKAATGKEITPGRYQDRNGNSVTILP